jgi:hypothetical protein
LDLNHLSSSEHAFLCSCSPALDLKQAVNLSRGQHILNVPVYLHNIVWCIKLTQGGRHSQITTSNTQNPSPEQKNNVSLLYARKDLVNVF